MKTKIVYVPKFLVRSHYAHLEYYGESFVSLVNGMVTDVYSSEDKLITQTNDQKLIKYLNKAKLNNGLNLQSGCLSVNNDYILDLYIFLIKKFDKKVLKIKKIKIFINHLTTAYSDIIVCSKNNEMLFYYINDNILYYDYISSVDETNSNVSEFIKFSLGTELFEYKKINLLEFIYVVNNYLFIDYDKICN